MDLFNDAVALMAKYVKYGGAALLVWGIVHLGSSLQESNGPSMKAALWQIVGGAVVIAGAEFFARITGLS